MSKIQKVPEARALIAAIRREGPIKIIAQNTSLSNQFGAFWCVDQRVICLAFSPAIEEGDLIGSLLFELHNAAVSSKFEHLSQLVMAGKITKAAYVREMEYLEYMNSHAAAKVAEKGIKMGVLPVEAKLPTYRTFEEHFSMQKRSGHSACFERTYDSLR